MGDGHGELLVADFDEDGTLDLVAGGELLLLGGPTGLTVESSVSLGPVFGLATADLDQDGELDLVGATGSRLVLAYGEILGTTPSSVSFPTDVEVDAPEITVTVRSTGTGGAPRGIDDVGIGDDPFGEFTLTRDECSGSHVAAGVSCELGVRFRPTLEGQATASLLIFDELHATSTSRSWRLAIRSEKADLERFEVFRSFNIRARLCRRVAERCSSRAAVPARPRLRASRPVHRRGRRSRPPVRRGTRSPGSGRPSVDWQRRSAGAACGSSPAGGPCGRRT